jgi:PHD/YefM family antitoxin component YafN of YafNO toxin-antitoxin module
MMTMVTVHKKLVVDEEGRPQEVILPWEEYRQIEELLGLDLDAEAVADLEEAARDREAGTPDAYLDLDAI